MFHRVADWDQVFYYIDRQTYINIIMLLQVVHRRERPSNVSRWWHIMPS